MVTCTTPQSYTAAEACGPIAVPVEIPHWFILEPVQQLAHSGLDSMSLWVGLAALAACAVGAFMARKGWSPR